MTPRPSAPTVSDDLALANRLADLADSVSLTRYRALDLVVETKPDRTPVTDADRAVEVLLRDTLADNRPDDAVLGEELGTIGTGSRRWILDPIDATANFIRGVPVWATLIALAVGDDVVVGVVSAPALGMRWWAASSLGAWSQQLGSQPRRLAASRVSKLEDGSVSYSDVTSPDWTASKQEVGFNAMLREAWRTRAYGDFWSHVLVAEGAVDVAVEPVLKLWDIAALIPIVTEAGGRVTGIDGSPALSAGSGLSSNGLLHAESLQFLAQDHN